MMPVAPEPRVYGRAIVIAEDQPEYLPLPANIVGPYVETKWKLTWIERLRVLWTGNFYLTLSTFGRPLQPIRCSVERLRQL